MMLSRSTGRRPFIGQRGDTVGMAGGACIAWVLPAGSLAVRVLPMGDTSPRPTTETKNPRASLGTSAGTVGTIAGTDWELLGLIRPYSLAPR